MSFFKNTIETEEELRSLFGYPSELAKRKVINFLDRHCQDFIAQSPFLVIATADAYGFCDVSPRGDSPGFIHVLDEKRLVIPERPGNNRVDTLRNIIANPRVGLLVLIPGLEETLRINGKACIVQDEKFLKSMAVKEKQPLVGIGIEVEECFIHCAKAFKRSRLWDPKAWEDKNSLPSAVQMLFDHAKLPETTLQDIENKLQDSYKNRLY